MHMHMHTTGCRPPAGQADAALPPSGTSRSADGPWTLDCRRAVHRGPLVGPGPWTAAKRYIQVRWWALDPGLPPSGTSRSAGGPWTLDCRRAVHPGPPVGPGPWTAAAGGGARPGGGPLRPWTLYPGGRTPVGVGVGGRWSKRCFVDIVLALPLCALVGKWGGAGRSRRCWE